MDECRICSLFLNSMCDTEATTDHGFTALHVAVAYRLEHHTIIAIKMNVRRTSILKTIRSRDEKKTGHPRKLPKSNE